MDALEAFQKGLEHEERAQRRPVKRAVVGAGGVLLPTLSSKGAWETPGATP